MEIKVINIEVEKKALEPMLLITTEIVYYDDLEAPVGITGFISSLGKIISLFNEVYISPANRSNGFEIAVIPKKQREVIYTSGNKYERKHRVQLHAPLSRKAIDHIENCREKNGDKSAIFNFEFVLKYLQSAPGTSDAMSRILNTPIIIVKSEFKGGYYAIKQSDWVSSYAPYLGIGNFILLEYRIPDKHSVGKDWVDLYERLYLRTQEMENAIRQTDWQKTMYSARQFYENINLGNGKDGHKFFETQLKQLFTNDQHGEVGFKIFLDGIRNFFDFAYIYVHDKDIKANLNALPIPTKEDAYFIFTLSVGLLNIIGRKVSNLN